MRDILNWCYNLTLALHIRCKSRLYTDTVLNRHAMWHGARWHPLNDRDRACGQFFGKPLRIIFSLENAPDACRSICQRPVWPVFWKPLGIIFSLKNAPDACRSICQRPTNYVQKLWLTDRSCSLQTLLLLISKKLFLLNSEKQFH